MVNQCNVISQGSEFNQVLSETTKSHRLGQVGCKYLLIWPKTNKWIPLSECSVTSADTDKAHKHKQMHIHIHKHKHGCMCGSFTCIIWSTIGQSEGVRMAPCLLVLFKPVNHHRSKCILIHREMCASLWHTHTHKQKHIALVSQLNANQPLPWQQEHLRPSPQVSSLCATSAALHQPEHVEDDDDEDDDQKGGQSHHDCDDRHVIRLVVVYIGDGKKAENKGLQDGL